MPARFAPRDVEIARRLRAAAEDDRVEVLAKLRGGNVLADRDAVFEHDPFVRQEREPSIEHVLFELELGNPIAQQAARSIGALEHRHPVTRVIQLVGSGQTRRTGSDNRHALCRFS